MNVLRLPLFRKATTALMALALLLQSATAVAPGPAWWTTQTVLDPSAPADDFAVANVGQLKYMATQAAAAMQASLPGGPGSTISAMISEWSLPPAGGITRDNYLAINHGQLKHVATPFYERLGLPYPWAGGSAQTDDYQLVNLGQLKHAFSFALDFRTAGQGATQIPATDLATALAAWNALPVKPAGSSTDDFDGDGIPNLQAYLMGKPLLDPNDLDGDRIPNTVEDAHSGILDKLRFTDAVADYDADGVMNYEELQLGLDLSASTTTGRTDGLTDAEVLAWGLAAGQPLVSSTDAVATLWSQIDATWITTNAGDYYLYWLDSSTGLAAFRTDVSSWVWQPNNPDAWLIENPATAYDSNWEPLDLDGDGVAELDRDYDTMPDLWEYRYALSPRDRMDAWDDPDTDTLTNIQEYQAGTNPRLADTDGDGDDDATEVYQGSNPNQPSSGPTLTLQSSGLTTQYIYVGQTTPALAVRVTQGGVPVMGVAVTFQLSTSGGRLLPASTTTGTPGSTLSQTTNSNGVAAVTYESGTAAGTASITASAVGAAATQSFSVTIVPIPLPYGSNDGTGGVGGSGQPGPVQVNPTRVPTPPRSTAMNAIQIADATSDGFRIKFQWKLDIESSYNPSNEYLAAQSEKSPVALVGWGPIIEGGSGSLVDGGWANHGKLEFEALPSPQPSQTREVPPGARNYLVQVYQGANFSPGNLPAPTYVGGLTFQYNADGARIITLTGNIPPKFARTDGSTSVTFEPSAAKSAAERAWIVMKPVTIQRDKNIANNVWEPMTDKLCKVLPGQKINLKVFFPEGVSATDFHWSITGGKFKNYPEPLQPPAGGAHVTPFEPSDFTGQEMHFYWSQSGRQEVAVNCSINGSRQYFRTNIEVISPECAFTANQKAIQLESPAIKYRDRCDWAASVSKLPQPFAEGAKWRFVQNICVTQNISLPDGTSKINENNGEWCLDNLATFGVSYAGRPRKNDGESDAASDEPFGGDENSGVHQFDQEFRTYVMFKSNENDSCWVPLKVIYWSMGFKATVGYWGVSFSDAYPQNDQKIIGVETHTLPEWSKSGSLLIIPKP